MPVQQYIVQKLNLSDINRSLYVAILHTLQTVNVSSKLYCLIHITYTYIVQLEQ